LKITNKQVSINLEGFDTLTGESFTFEGISNVKTKYYSIKNITTRINSMDFLDTLEAICRSSKDIGIVNNLLELHGKDNILRVSNGIGNYSKKIGISRQKLSDVLKRMENLNLVYKLDIGVYFINPFIWIGRRVKSNELRENCQIEWESLTHEQ